MLATDRPKRVSAGISTCACAAITALLFAGTGAAGNAEPEPTPTAPADASAAVVTPGATEATPAVTPTPAVWWPRAGLQFHWDPSDYELQFRVQQPIPERLLDRLAMTAAQPNILSGSMGMRVQVDGAAYEEGGGLAPIGDEINVRRGYVNLQGRIDAPKLPYLPMRPVFVAFEFGFLRGFYVSKLEVRLEDLPYVGRFRIGYFTPPLSLELLNSSWGFMLMEPSAAAQAFGPGTRVGMQFDNSVLDDRLTWAVGWFSVGTSRDYGTDSNDLSNTVGRVTALPFVGTIGGFEQFLHVGMSGIWSVGGRKSVEYRTRPESYWAPFLYDTGNLDTDDTIQGGIEAAWVVGPASVQTEALGALAQFSGGDTAELGGVYVAANLFLTGEQRRYDRRRGVFNPIQPRHNLSFRQWTFGAWEVASRCTHVDLSDGRVRGGRGTLLSAGLNWYWNANVRWMLSYVYDKQRDGPENGQLHVFQMRAQLMF